MTADRTVSAHEMAGRRVKADKIAEAFRALASPTTDPEDIDWPDVLAFASSTDDDEWRRRLAAAVALAGVRKPSEGTIKVVMNTLHERAYPRVADPFDGF